MSYIWSISGLIFLWTSRLRESTRVLSKSAYCYGGDNNLGLIVIPKDAAAQRFAVNDSIVGRPSNRFIAKVFPCILQWFFYFYCLFLFFPVVTNLNRIFTFPQWSERLRLAPALGENKFSSLRRPRIWTLRARFNPFVPLIPNFCCLHIYPLGKGLISRKSR